MNAFYRIIVLLSLIGAGDCSVNKAEQKCKTFLEGVSTYLHNGPEYAEGLTDIQKENASKLFVVAKDLVSKIIAHSCKHIGDANEHLRLVVKHMGPLYKGIQFEEALREINGVEKLDAQLQYLEKELATLLINLKSALYEPAKEKIQGILTRIQLEIDKIKTGEQADFTKELAEVTVVSEPENRTGFADGGHAQELFYNRLVHLGRIINGVIPFLPKEEAN